MLDDTERTVFEQDDHDWPDKLPAHQWNWRPGRRPRPEPAVGRGFLRAPRHGS